MAETPLDSFDEDLEGGEEEPLEGGEPEPEAPVAEPEKPEKGPVPWNEFQEVYAGNKQLKAQLEQQQQLMWQQGQSLQQQQQMLWQLQQSQGKPEPVDPQLEEVEKLIAPMIEKRLVPLAQRYQQTMMVMEAQTEAQAALNYFETQVPYHKEIEKDFIEYLDSDPVIKRRAFADPVFAVQTAKYIKALKDSGQLKATSQAKDAVRSRAKSESGGNSPSLTSQQIIDYNDMSDEAFANVDAQIARRARR